MILRNGRPFNTSEAFTTEDGTQYPANWYVLATPEERAALGFTEVTDNLSYDSRYYNMDGTERPIVDCRNSAKTSLAVIRWNKETAGVIYANSLFQTSQQDRVNYFGALQLASMDPNYTVVWKAQEIPDSEAPIFNSTPKFVSLAANDVITLVQSGVSYISQCFEHEKELTLQIEAAETLSELLAIDLEAGWPNRVIS